MLRASVLIPTYRRPDELARCLDGIAAQSRLPEEVLIAHRHDDAATALLLQSGRWGGLPLTAVQVGRANASEARNLCLRLATGDIIVLLDDDAVPRIDWLARIVARFEADPQLGAIGGPDWPHGRETPVADPPLLIGAVQWWGRRIGNHHCGTAALCEVEWLKGANMSMRRAALSDAPFGRDLCGAGAQFAEDVAVTLLMRRQGWRLQYDPAIAVDHYSGPLMAGSDHRRLRDHTSLRDAAHNETIAMLDYLPAWRRAVFLIWSVTIGTRLLPGLAAAVVMSASAGPGVFRRWAIVSRGRIQGWSRWRRRPASPVSAAKSVINPAPRHICLVTHVLTRHDGQGRVNLELAKHLLSRGYEVTAVASEVDADLLETAGFSWIRVPVPRHVPEALRWGIFAVGSWLRVAHITSRFDVIHLNGAIAPLPAHVNTSHFVHSTSRRTARLERGRGLFAGLYQRLVTVSSCYFERKAYPAAGKVVAVSEAVRQSLVRDAGVAQDHVEVIPLGVDSTRFHPRRPGEPSMLREELQLDDAAFLMLFVGDAKSPRKNLDVALRTLAKLDQNFHLAIVGSWRGGPYRRQARRLGIGERTHFLGVRPDIPECFRDADVFFCLAHYEPASLVLLEAMASGVPVISTPEVGNAVFLRSGTNGFLLSSGDDVDRAVQIIQTLAADRTLGAAIGHAARDTVASLTWRRMGQQYEQLYSDVSPRQPEQAA